MTVSIQRGQFVFRPFRLESVPSPHPQWGDLQVGLPGRDRIPQHRRLFEFGGGAFLDPFLDTSLPCPISPPCGRALSFAPRPLFDICSRPFGFWLALETRRALTASWPGLGVASEPQLRTTPFWTPPPNLSLPPPHPGWDERGLASRAMKAAGRGKAAEYRPSFLFVSRPLLKSFAKMGGSGLEKGRSLLSEPPPPPEPRGGVPSAFRRVLDEGRDPLPQLRLQPGHFGVGGCGVAGG